MTYDSNRQNQGSTYGYGQQRLGAGVARHEGDYYEPQGSQKNVGTPERWISALGGGLLLTMGLGKKDATGLAMTLVGSLLLHRGVSGHSFIYDALGNTSLPNQMQGRGQTQDGLLGQVQDRMGQVRDTVQERVGQAQEQIKERMQDVTSENPVRVEESVTVNKPVADVYRFWRNLENLPRFMSHLESVKSLGGGRSHWTAKGPAGTSIDWDAMTTDERVNERISWRSLEGSQVPNHGKVEFREAQGGQSTEIRVELEYNPPGGAVGAAVAKLFGEEPSQQIRDDLQQLKQKLESGEFVTTGG